MGRGFEGVRLAWERFGGGGQADFGLYLRAAVLEFRCPRGHLGNVLLNGLSGFKSASNPKPKFTIPGARCVH